MTTKIDTPDQPPQFITRMTQITVMPKDEATYSELSTTITIEDEAAGEFVAVEQHGRNDRGKIAINPEEWPVLRAAIDQLIGECRL